MRFAYLLALLIVACGGGGGGGAVIIGPHHDIVMIGDSITSRWDLVRSFPKLDIYNAGVGGETSFQLLARFDKDVLAWQPRVVIIQGGNADVALGAENGTTAVEIMAGRASSTGSKVVLLSLMSRNPRTPPLVPDDTPMIRTRIIEFNRLLWSLCITYGYICVDNYVLSTLPDGSLDLALAADFVHPNEKLYNMMAAKLLPLIESE